MPSAPRIPPSATRPSIGCARRSAPRRRFTIEASENTTARRPEGRYCAPWRNSTKFDENISTPLAPNLRWSARPKASGWRAAAAHSHISAAAAMKRQSVETSGETAPSCAFSAIQLVPQTKTVTP